MRTLSAFVVVTLASCTSPPPSQPTQPKAKAAEAGQVAAQAPAPAPKPLAPGEGGAPCVAQAVPGKSLGGVQVGMSLDEAGRAIQDKPLAPPAGASFVEVAGYRLDLGADGKVAGITVRLPEGGELACVMTPSGNQRFHLSALGSAYGGLAALGPDCRVDRQDHVDRVTCRQSGLEIVVGDVRGERATGGALRVFAPRPADDTCPFPVVPGKGIGPVRLGMTLDQVNAAAGTKLAPGAGSRTVNHGGWMIGLGEDGKVAWVDRQMDVACLEAKGGSKKIDLTAPPEAVEKAALPGCKFELRTGGNVVVCQEGKLSLILPKDFLGARTYGRVQVRG